MAKLQSSALSGAIVSEAVSETRTKVETNGAVIEQIANELVAAHCKQLDDFMETVKAIVEDKANPPTDLELDDMVLNIPILLYFAGEAQESLGIREDIAKAVKAEDYNKAYNNATGTIADKTALAELQVIDKTVIHSAYQRAYKKVKFKIEAAYEVLQSIKKVVSRRTVEYELTRVSPERIGGR